jgi:hypothetical protein
MVGYVLENTLTESGTVSRGICEVSENGYLVDVTERTSISREGDHAVFDENGEKTSIPLDSIASMNCWGFTPDIFAGVEEGFRAFLSDLGSNPLKCEYYLPFAVRELMAANRCKVKVYESDSAWYGVTYHEDKEKVKAGIQQLKENGTYPECLSK